MTPDLLIDVVHYRTGELIETQLVIGPLEWLQRKDGSWWLNIPPGCGRPTPDWIAANPRPA